uniref:Uncharacterized protein n=1 Tax=Fagus sylvatica TaxID=28930 RepID=A0A2N9IPR9_FAGSY
MVLPVRVLMKICIPPRRRRTKWSVLSILDVVIGEGAAVFKLLVGEDKPLLVQGDSFFVLDFCLDVIYGVGAFDLESDGLSSQGLNEDLHTTTETEDEMES